MRLSVRFAAAALAAVSVVGVAGMAGAAHHAVRHGKPVAYTVKIGTAMVAGHSEKVLTDSQGHTLYYLVGSTAAKVGCTAACAKFWPPLVLAKGNPAVQTGISGVTVAKTADGRMVLFRGHPLFAFAGDKKAGQATGQGFKKVWFVATTALKA